MADEAAIWAEHAAVSQKIFAEATRRLQGPEPAGMVFPDVMADLSRNELATAAKLGVERDAIMGKLAGDRAKLKEMCGV